MDKTSKMIVGVIVVLVVVWIGINAFGGNKKEASVTNSTITEETTAERVTIGFMGPLSGDAASYGESIKRGVDLAKKELGIDTIDVVYEDSKCEGKDAVNAINKLISVDKVAAIVGEVCSGATLAAAPVAQENNVVMVSAASTSPKLSEAGDYIFRTVPSDALQGAFGAELVYNRDLTSMAILYGNEEYGVGFEQVLREKFIELGGEIVASESFERGVLDVRTQLTKIKATNPAALYIISNSPATAATALRQAKELGIAAALFGSEGLKSPDILEGAQEAAEGLVLSTVSSGSSDFAQQHLDEYTQEPGPFAAQGYDAFYAIAQAVHDGAVSGAQIRDALFVSEFDGASGQINFDDNGDVAGNYDVYEVKDGAFIVIE